MAYTNGSFCLRHFLEILDVKAVVFLKKKRYFFKQRNCAFYGSIFKNHFVTNFAFKAGLDTIIDSNLVQDDIFSDIKRYMLNKTAE